MSPSLRWWGQQGDCDHPARPFCLLEGDVTSPTLRGSTHEAPVLAPPRWWGDAQVWPEVGAGRGVPALRDPRVLLGSSVPATGWLEVGFDCPMPWDPAHERLRKPLCVSSLPHGDNDPKSPLPVPTHGSLGTSSSPLAGCRLLCPGRGQQLRLLLELLQVCFWAFSSIWRLCGQSWAA